ncbi:MAG TPA: branched-chain amino acid ABC transporter permease [Amycolatopsis sp.]|nr:branched-chain amino acid ABC transporter permease [Amycolatopsis sp.]
MQQVLNALVLWSIYVLFALGLSLAWGTLNVLNLAHGATFMFGAFSVVLLSEHADIPFGVLVPLAMVFGGLISVLLDLLVFRPIRARVGNSREAELLMLIGSVGAASIMVTIAQQATDDSPFGIPEGSALRSAVYRFGGFSISTIQIVIIVLGVALAALLGWWIRSSRYGRALRAVAFDGETAQLMGVNPGRLSTATMFAAGALAGLASVLLISHVGALTPTSGDNLLLKAFAMIILGGIGSIAGVLAGAAVVAVGETLVLTFTSGTWVDAASFAIIIAVILIRPQGIFVAQKADRV